MATNVISNTPSMSGGVSKVTPQGSVVINASLSMQEYMKRRSSNSSGPVYDNLSEETYTIGRGELLFARKEGNVHFNTTKNASLVPVFSSFNGVTAGQNVVNSINSGDKAKSKHGYTKLADEFWFVGTAQGDKGKRDMENRSLALAVRVAGSDTIFNSGSEPIHPGDLVTWRLPVPGVDTPHARSGEPSGKVLPIIEKYKIGNNSEHTEALLQHMPADLYGYKKGLKHAIGQMKGGLTSGDAMAHLTDESGGKATREAIAELVDIFAKIQNETSGQRVIGKALTEGQPGRMFDVLLTHCHPVC